MTDNENSSVNIQYFDEITGGDFDLQKALVDIFISSAKECVDCCNDNTDISLLKANLHALRGISEGIGAVKLSNLCLEAEENYSDDNSNNTMLTDILDEYSKVVNFLDNKYS